MRIIKWTIIISSVLFFTTAACYGADVAKIGVVDFQKILTTSNAGKKAQAEINKKGKKLEAELKAKGQALEKQKESYEREALVMDKKMRQQKELELRGMFNDFKTLQQKNMVEFKKEEKRVITKIRNDILAIVEKISKKEGFLLVVEKREGGVLYSPKKLDITDKVIKSLNAKKGK